ncbi:uncharacterized protein LOC111039040 isoform X2 [Myzus persicae]|uniref:uncharacterized protein LOC111039040 isoform X2 n=1 Tax=Myzus persicae TaxID=13164 RepID=UPI000B935DBC|nr:uncharacterized protein LOC111039040 isoform X2 [Myzus persicae]
MEVDEPNYEFSTLKCQWSLTDSPTVTVHLKVAFHDEAADDQTRMALQVTSIVDDNLSDCVVYRGFVIGNKAADQTLHSGVRHDDDDSAAVRIWLRDARAALLGSGDKPTTAEYEYHLRREDHNDDRLLTLAWKIKLRPFGLATLGMVQMAGETATMSLTCNSFITPLIGMLSAERKQKQQSDLATADREGCLLEDNRRLLNELQLMSEGRRLEDQRLMAQFVEVLNAKKRQIVDLQHKLDELKLEPDMSQPVAVEQEKVIVRQRRGRGTCRGRPGPIKKIRRSTTHGENKKKLCSSSSEDDNATLRCINSNNSSGLEEIDKLNCDNTSDENIPVSTTDKNIPVDPRYFADTQIDSPNSSPTWLQQPLTNSPNSSPTWLQQPLTNSPLPQLQPSINQHSEHQLPKKKSVLDDLWNGIV